MGEIFSRFLVKGSNFPTPPPTITIDPYTENPYMAAMRPFVHFHIPFSKYYQSRSYYKVTYNINSRGFRGPEIPPKNQLKRLVFIGDSMVEGHGVEFKETFSFGIGKKLKNHGWETINAGVQGGSPLYYAANLKRYLALDPDMVVIVLFENDLFDDRLLENHYFQKPILDNAKSLYTTNLLSILYTSRLFTLLQRGINHIIPYPIDHIIEQNRHILTLNKEQRYLNVKSPWLVAPSMFSTQWEMSKKYLENSIADFKKHNVKLLLVNLTLGALGPGLDSSFYGHSHRINNSIISFARETKTPVLSLLPVIKKAFTEKTPNELMIEHDGHPTPFTHNLIEESLLPWIKGFLQETTLE